MIIIINLYVSQEKLEPCKEMCDFCRNPTQVKSKALSSSGARFSREIVKGQIRTPNQGGREDLYEGGRATMKYEARNIIEYDVVWR